MSALEDAIVAAPNDAARYAVLADALMARGDVRGELIALQLRLSSITDPAEFATLKAKERALLAEVSAAALGKLADGFSVEWRWGFVHRLVCTSSDRAALASLLMRPAVRAVQAVRISRVGTRGGELADTLITAQPAALSRFEIVDSLLPDGVARRMVVAHPKLEHVRMLGDLASPVLLELEGLKSLEVSRLTAHDVLERNLERAPWTALRRLTLSAPDLPVQCVLAALQLPKLTQVRLALSDFEPVLKALARRDDLSQLSELHLLGLVTDQHLAPLLERVHELKALKLTLPARGLNLDTVVLLRRHLKVQLLGVVRAEDDPGTLTMTRDEAIAWREQQDRAFAERRAEQDYD